MNCMDAADSCGQWQTAASASDRGHFVCTVGMNQSKKNGAFFRSIQKLQYVEQKSC